jgi:hypothetical protein
LSKKISLILIDREETNSKIFPVSFASISI